MSEDLKAGNEAAPTTEAGHLALRPDNPASLGEAPRASVTRSSSIAEILRIEERRGRRRRLTRMGIAAAALIVFLAGGAWLWSSWRSGATLAYVTDPVTRGDLVVLLTATGTLQPSQQVAVTSLVTGTIASVTVDYNETVKKGQVLARLDTPELDNQLDRAIAMVDAQTASRDAASAAVTDAEAALRRANQLPEGQVVSARDLELATTALQRAKANLAAAQAQLQAAQADLAGARREKANSTVTAPIDGVVLEVNADVGETVNAASLATALFTIASDLHRLDLEVDIDEADVAQVSVGDPVTFSVESSPDEALNGEVRQVRTAPTITNGVISYKAMIAVDNPDLQLRPGMTATADISIDVGRDVLTVSNAALRFSPDQAASAGPFGSMLPQSTVEVKGTGEQRVYALAQGQLTPVVVTAGRTDGQRTEVESDDLAEGDLVVTGLNGR